MDHELYKQRQEFMKRATENVAKNSNVKSSSSITKEIPSSSTVNKLKKTNSGSSTNITNDFKSIQNSMAGPTSKFAIQTKFMKYMKERHLQRDDHFLTVDEALDEMNERHIPSSIKNWLIEEALPKNPKIEVSENRFRFKPLYNIKNRRELRNLLEDQFLNGNGNILLNDLKECYPEAERHVNKLGDQVVKFVRATDKEIAIGFNPSFTNMESLSDKDRFRQIFHSINIENIPLKKMEESLQNNDFKIIHGSSGNAYGNMSSGGVNVNGKQLKPPGGKRRISNANRKNKIRSNAHLESILLNYD